MLPALFGLVAIRVAGFAILVLDIRGGESSATYPLWDLQEARAEFLQVSLVTVVIATPSLPVLRSHPRGHSAADTQLQEEENRTRPRIPSPTERTVPRLPPRLAPRRRAFFPCPPQPPPADTQLQEEEGKWRPRMPQRRAHRALAARFAPRRCIFFFCPPRPHPAGTQLQEKQGKRRPRMPHRTVLRRRASSLCPPRRRPGHRHLALSAPARRPGPTFADLPGPETAVFWLLSALRAHAKEP